MTVTLTKIVQTCGACPSQWDAWDTEGTEYYIRFRWGFLSVTKGGVSGEAIYGKQVSDDLDGFMDTETMLNKTGMVLVNVGESDA